MTRRALQRSGASAAPVLRAEVEAAARYADAAKAPSTRRLYATDWRIFTAWCAARGIQPLPSHPGAVATFLAAEAEAGASPSTITRRLAAIGHYHKEAGHLPPHRTEGGVVITRVVAGISRTHGRPPKRASAAENEVLAAMLSATPPDSLRAIRNRALVALGMAAALRRSELPALTVPDIHRRPTGLLLHIARSKTDQHGQGALVPVPEGRHIRPVALLDEWLDAAGIEEGPIFRTLAKSGAVLPRAMCDRDVARVVAAMARAAGLEGRWSGHSLRAGYITAAVRGGANILRIKPVSRHKNVNVLAGYDREADPLRDTPGEDFL